MKNNPPSQTPVIINKDGSLNIHRPKEAWRFFSDLYHSLLSVSWPRFFVFLISVFFIGNLFFALLFFYAGPEAVKGVRLDNEFDRFVDCFFFSVQSLNGPFVPVGLWSNILVTVEGYLGMLTLVIATGLLYARFARPRARLLFSENMIINHYNGKPCLTFRVANERLNQIGEARMTLTMTKLEKSLEGETSRKLYNLKLEGDYSPLFALSWTIRHFIDESSPLFGLDEKALTQSQVVVFASLSGIDETFSQTVTARNVYRYDEIVYNKKFKDILVWDQNEKKMHINLKGINDMVS